jgi:hypothetical protein
MTPAVPAWVEMLAFVAFWCVVAIGADVLFCALWGRRRDRS